MGLTREERKLLHQKSKQPTFGNGKPDSNPPSHHISALQKREIALSFKMCSNDSDFWAAWYEKFHAWSQTLPREQHQENVWRPLDQQWHRGRSLPNYEQDRPVLLNEDLLANFHHHAWMLLSWYLLLHLLWPRFIS